MCKQLVTAVCVGMFMSAIAMSNPEDSLIEICVDVPRSQIRPAIDGDLVAWEDGLDISWLKLSDPNLIQHTIVIGGVQDFAAVGGSRIVWRDKNTDYDIGIYDVELGADWMLSSNDGATQRYPAASAEYILCEDNSGGTYNAAVYDEATDAFVVIDPSTALQSDIEMDGSVVVWRDTRNGIHQVYMCDLSVKPYQAAPVDPTGDNQWRPDICGDRIVWEDHTDGSQIDLVVWSISAGEVVWVCEDAGDQINPAISEDLIVWQERTSDDILGCDLNSGEWLTIAVGNAKDENPVVSGRTVVWQRNGTDIVGTVIPQPDLRALAVTEPLGGEQLLADQDELLIAWEMLEGDLPDEVTIEFSSDAGDNWDIVEPNVPADAPYLWSPVADVHSEQCQIRVSIFGDESIDAVSEMFTIFQCDPALTADVTGDCVVDIADFAAMAAQWLACGNPYDETGCFR